MKRRRSPNYVFTVESTEDARLRGTRAAVRHTNRLGLTDLRVMLSPRAGRDSPHAWKRQNRFKPPLRLEDARSIDVYLVPKKSAGGRSESGNAARRR